MRPKQPSNFRIYILLVVLSLTNVAWAKESSSDLTQLSLEDLMNIEVYSPGKREQSFWDTAAAIYIITPEDIRRSGATNIPDLLRMVPGVVVQQLDSNSWDISARGFNGSIFANKLLVLIDGRAVYTPLFGGVLWDVQDVVLEDIERIEVIRGPGGTLWGANAVNGVINVITKRSQDTQGTLLVAGGGSEERGFGTLRHGAQSGEWAYRGYGKYFNRDAGFRPGDDSDKWDMARGGFRTDSDRWTFQGDIYEGEIGQLTNSTHFTEPFARPVTEPIDARGGNLLGRYEHDQGFLQLYWDMTDKNFQIFSERRDKIDLEYMHHVALTENQQLSWGAGYRLERESVSNTDTITVNEPDAAMDQIFNLFVQDEISLMDERMKFIVGTKVEHNVYTGVEVQPNARVLYHLDDRNTVWTAVSRAVRTPSRLDTDGNITTSTFLSLMGNRDVDSEKLWSYELGYRHRPHDKIFLDLALFANHYDDLITFDTGDTVTIQGQDVTLLPTVNGMTGEVHGGSLASEMQVAPWWKIKGYYSILKMNLHRDPNISDFGLATTLEKSVPRHFSYIRSSFDLPGDFELDTIVRFMDSIRDGGIPSYTELDIVLGKTLRGWDISLVGRNLIEEHHKEAVSPVEIERSGYIKVTREF